MSKLFLLFLVTAIQIYSQVYSDTFYVNPNNSGIEDGQTFNTGWKDFTKFNINTDVPSNSLILVAPSTYTKGNLEYYLVDSGVRKNAILFIRDRTNITIRKFGSGEVYFVPEDTIQYGVWIQPTSSEKIVNNIIVDSIFFRNVKDNAIRVSGYSITNRADHISLKNCKMELSGSNSAIFCQRADYIYIDSCNIYSVINETNNAIENDGIYMQNVNNVFLTNDTILIGNNYAGINNPHVDGIQITQAFDINSSNITIQNNYIENVSDVNYFVDRQGVHITYTSGYIRFWNNIVKTKKGDGLLNIHFINELNELTIYNNTFYAEQDQRSLMQIVYYPNTVPGHLPDKLGIFNNIFYKTDGSTSLDLIRFSNVDTLTLNSTVLNNNLYYIGNYSNTDDYRTSFSSYDGNNYSAEYTKKWNHNWENSGKAANPLFISSSDLHIQYGSPAKNLGTGLVTEGLLNDFNRNQRPYWNKDFDCGAYEVQGDAQLKIGVTNGTNLTFTVSTPGTYWQRDNTGLFSISSNTNYLASTFTVPGEDTNKNNWKGWDFGWLSIQNDSNKQFAHGIYKLTYKNENDTSKYIFIDYRDAISSYSPNIYIRYNSDLQKFAIFKNNTFYGNELENGSILRIWDLNNSGVSYTTGLNSYWANALVSFFDNSNHPVLIWGPYPNTNYYRLFRYNSGDPTSVYLTSSALFNWTDTTVYKNINQLDSGTHYYLMSIWANISTDTVSIQETTNEIWSGNINMANVVKVPSGKTLTINPGTRINLYSTSSFNVLGKLIAEGTAANQITFTSANSTTPGSWGPLTLNGAHNSSIKYSKILYGTEIDVINSNNVIIQNCNIDSSSMHGINFSGGTGCIATNDTIKNSNTAHGILIQNGAGVTCTANTIKKTTYNHTGVGIYFGGGGTGIATQNDITGFSWGIGASWGSSLTSYSGQLGLRNNRVANSNYGLMVYNSSYATLGIQSANDRYGNNSIQGISYNAYTYNSGSFQSGISGYHNFWGYPLDPSKFYCGTGSYLYYLYFLSNDPWAGIAPLVSIKLPENIANNSLALTKTNNSTASTSESEGNSSDISTAMDSLNIGISLRDRDYKKEAKDFFISYLKLHPENQAAYTCLYGCADQNTTPEITNFFESLPSKASIEHKLLLAYLYLKQGSVDLAKQVNNQIADNNLNTPLGTRAILNNFYIALYNENDIETARSLLNMVKSQAELSTEMELKTAEDALSVYSSVINPNYRMSFEKQPNKVIEQPKSYYLSQNYPNPFNPSTTIIYSIKDPGLVKLELFDILGRKVSTLVNEEKQPGEYKVNFVGGNLASGVYIYRITSGTFTQVKKMQFIK